MTINCAGAPEPVTQSTPKKVEWNIVDKTVLEELAEKRRIAQEALAAQFKDIDPVVQKQHQSAVAAQQYYETMSFEAGKRATLSPDKVNNTMAWLANWLGVKSSSLGLVREPLLNMKRLTEGMLREAAIYNMLGKANTLSKTLKRIAKERGVALKLDDTRRLIEEGMTPQRLNLYGNTPLQEATLMTRYSTWRKSMLDRGFMDDDLDMLLQEAQTVSSQFDEILAVSKATGMNVGELNNIGYFPRQFSEDGFTAARLAGAVKTTDIDSFNAAMSKSRATWEYLVEDHTMASKLLGVTTEELHALIANPIDFAMYLHNRVDVDQLDLLVDSGVFSKIPMLTSHVEEYLTKLYKIPGMDAGLFIADPVEASAQYIRKLQAGAERSAMVRYIADGVKEGWAVPRTLADIDPTQFSHYVHINKVPGFGNIQDDILVHPQVAAHAAGIIRLSSSPGQLGEFANGYQMFVNWFTKSFAKQALGNPITAKTYLFGQFFGNMLAAFGRGVQPRHYVASFIDIVRVSMGGLDVLDNVKPFRYVDGKFVTHRELVAKTLRMFSRDVLPGVHAGELALDLNKLNPIYTIHQLQQLYAQSNNVAGYAGEVAKLMGGKADAVFTPTLKIAQMMDLAGQLAIVRGKAKLASSDVGEALEGLEQFAFGWSVGKLDKWDDLVLEVKRGMPMFDDMGRIPSAVARIVPFSSWAMGNLPLQLKSMMREPSRWYNYVRVHALWNSAQLEANERAGGSNPTNGEMQQWERDMYGMVTQIDPATRKVHMLFTANFDPRWGVWAGVNQLFTPQPEMEKMRSELKQSSGARFLQSLIGKTYFAGIYEAISGIDPLTGIKRDDSIYKSEQFGNIPMPGWVAGILSISPVLQSLDRMEAISGTREILDPRTGAVVREATQGWLGNKGKLQKHQLEGVEAFVQMVGGKVRVIDGLTNMQFTEADTKRAVTKLTADAFTAQKQLAQEIKVGGIKRDSAEYQRRVETIRRMYNTAMQLNLDLARIQIWASQQKLPSRDMLQLKRDAGLAMDKMPLPGADYVQQLLEQHTQFNKEMP